MDQVVFIKKLFPTCVIVFIMHLRHAAHTLILIDVFSVKCELNRSPAPTPRAQLLEDMLASLIENMPAYPLPFLIALIKRKAGVNIDNSGTNYKTLLDQSVTENRRALDELTADHDAEIRRAQIDFDRRMQEQDLQRKTVEDTLQSTRAKLERAQTTVNDQQSELDSLQNKLRKALQEASAVDSSKVESAAPQISCVAFSHSLTIYRGLLYRLC